MERLLYNYAATCNAEGNSRVPLVRQVPSQQKEKKIYIIKQSHSETDESSRYSRRIFSVLDCFCSNTKHFILQMHYVCDPAISLLGIYLREMKTCVPKKDSYENIYSSLLITNIRNSLSVYPQVNRQVDCDISTQ